MPPNYPTFLVLFNYINIGIFSQIQFVNTLRNPLIIFDITPDTLSCHIYDYLNDSAAKRSNRNCTRAESWYSSGYFEFNFPCLQENVSL